jgi:hypothetical protein
MIGGIFSFLGAVLKALPLVFFMGLTQITPKSCYHGKHAEESSKQI